MIRVSDWRQGKSVNPNSTVIVCSGNHFRAGAVTHTPQLRRRTLFGADGVQVGAIPKFEHPVVAHRRDRSIVVYPSDIPHPLLVCLLPPEEADQRRREFLERAVAVREEISVDVNFPNRNRAIPTGANKPPIL
jgi:hypothetical protein